MNFVGGGGKTGLIHKLMEEYALQGPVVCTTTTRIHPPPPSEGMVLLSSDNLSLLKDLMERVSRDCAIRRYKLIVTRHFMTPHLLRGVPPDFFGSVRKESFPIFLNEADGAASYSLKIPREGEPVLMEGADFLVPVIGVDCLYQPLGPEVVFRFRQFADRMELTEGERITPDMAARILMHPDGVCRGWRPGAPVIPFINKVDGPAQLEAARELAKAILRNPAFPVQRVVFGSVLRNSAASISA